MRGANPGVKPEKSVKGRGGTQNKCRAVKLWVFAPFSPAQYTDLYSSSSKYQWPS